MLEPDRMIGVPTNDAPDTGAQDYATTCAIRCQEYIIERFTGVMQPQEVYVKEAIDHHIFDPQAGTNPSDVGKLLELHGIPVTHYDHATTYDLAKELAQGHKVIVGVNSSDLWGSNSLMDSILNATHLHGADHAVVVSGIDTSDPHHVQVIVSDPGTGEAAAHYPVEQFVGAWKDSGFFMVATVNQPPEHLHWPEMEHFPYDQGHIDMVGRVPYAEFVSYESHADDWDPFATAGHGELDGGHADHGSDLMVDHHDMGGHDDLHHADYGSHDHNDAFAHDPSHPHEHFGDQSIDDIGDGDDSHGDDSFTAVTGH